MKKALLTTIVSLLISSSVISASPSTVADEIVIPKTPVLQITVNNHGVGH